jgi:hypothetical protein
VADVEAASPPEAAHGALTGSKSWAVSFQNGPLRPPALVSTYIEQADVRDHEADPIEAVTQRPLGEPALG